MYAGAVGRLLGALTLRFGGMVPAVAACNDPRRRSRSANGG